MKNLQKYKEPYLIGRGCQGEVHRISDEHVVKRSMSIKRESEMANALYETGISVPKPEGLCRVIIPSIAPFELNGFAMKYIEGSRDLLDSGHILNLRDKEIEKAKNLGFIPGGDWRSNYLYEHEKDKVYLIDFADWGRK